MTADYIYKRQDGGTTACYGPLEDNSNFGLVCVDEDMDGIWVYRDPDVLKTWHQICKYLEENYCDSIEQLESL